MQSIGVPIPDNYPFVGKHFNTTRSIGSGEVWLYHLGGGSNGIGLTKRPSVKFQKDIGEPALVCFPRYVTGWRCVPHFTSQSR